jgi:putative addiction module component (TIGR02574 family)
MYDASECTGPETSMTAADLTREALKLPEAARAELAGRLLESLDPPDPHAHFDDDQLAEELVRRDGELERGEAPGVAWDELRARLERELSGGGA